MSVGEISSGVPVGEISVFESLSQFSHVVVVCSGDLTKPAP